MMAQIRVSCLLFAAVLAAGERQRQATANGHPEEANGD